MIVYVTNNKEPEPEKQYWCAKEGYSQCKFISVETAQIYRFLVYD